MRLLPMLCLLALAGCASGLKLPSPSGAFPSEIEFEGDWRRIESREEDRMEPDRLNLPTSREATARRSSGPKAKPGRKVRAFLEYGRQLRITQLDTALLISFDRSIVREYRYGEHRMTNVGPIVGERTTGFNGDVLEVITLDDAGGLMTESWRVKRSGRQLERRVTIIKGKRDLYELRETYVRDPG
ncbi:MAG: hypothetical protein AAGI27_06925 [Pseudomonadota bacterium]